MKLFCELCFDQFVFWREVTLFFVGGRRRDQIEIMAPIYQIPLRPQRWKIETMKHKIVVLRIFKKQFLLWYEFHGALKRTNPACFETITDCLLFSLKYTFIIKFSYHHFFWKCWINNNFYFLKETMDEEVPRTGLLISKSEITKE